MFGIQGDLLGSTIQTCIKMWNKSPSRHLGLNGTPRCPMDQCQGHLRSHERSSHLSEVTGEGYGVVGIPAVAVAGRGSLGVCLAWAAWTQGSLPDSALGTVTVAVCFRAAVTVPG